MHSTTYRLYVRPVKERDAHEKAHRDAQAALLRIERATERIRQMTKVYVERQDGTVAK